MNLHLKGWIHYTIISFWCTEGPPPPFRHCFAANSRRCFHEAPKRHGRPDACNGGPQVDPLAARSGVNFSKAVLRRALLPPK